MPLPGREWVAAQRRTGARLRALLRRGGGRELRGAAREEVRAVRIYRRPSVEKVRCPLATPFCDSVRLFTEVTTPLRPPWCVRCCVGAGGESCGARRAMRCSLTNRQLAY